jgi:predicted metal-dependent peptidase
MDIEKELIRGIVHLARIKEFYGHIIQQFEKVIENKPTRFGGELIDTACVGRVKGDKFIKLYLIKSYFESLYDRHGEKEGKEYLLAALEHEILHIVFNHLFLSFSDKNRGAVAVDCVVNQYLSKVHENWITVERFKLPHGKSARWYYDHLKGNPQYEKDAEALAQRGEGILKGLAEKHSLWEDVRNDVVAKEFIKDIVRKADEFCRNSTYGNIPGEVQNQIGNLLKREKAIIPWGRVLRMFVANSSESTLEFTMKRESRRFGTRPGTRKAEVVNLAVILDTSASISNDELKAFFNEIRWLHKKGVKITVFEADTVVTRSYKFRGKFDGTVTGRGGTDLEPALIEVEGKYDAAIYFTDFQAGKVSRKYRIPTLWVLTDNMPKERWPYPWGRHIKIDIDRRVASKA